MYKFDCVIIGKKLKSGEKLKKETGEVKPWSDVYTPDGNVVRVYGFDSSALPDMADVQLHCNCRLFDNNMFLSFVKVVK